MPKFFYTARDASGRKINGSEDAPSEDEIISRLQSRNLIVIDIGASLRSGKSKSKSAPKKGVRRKHYRITGDDLVLFCRQLATLLGAGVTVLKSLQIIAKQIASQKLYLVIQKLEKSMEGGLSLHEAMAKHRDIFSDLWINLVESGEASGNLSLILERLATYLERNAAFKRKIVSALIYPIILFIAGIGALLFLVVRIIPTFAELFTTFEMELPKLTQLLVDLSDFIRRFFLVIIIGFLAAIVSFRKYIKTGYGRRRYEKLIFKLPMFGEFSRIMVAERFTAGLATLLESGVPILYSLEISEHSVDCLVLSDIIRDIKEEVRKGESLSQPLEKSGFFEPMAVQMVNVGEEIGELPMMFKKINAFYQEYIETFLTRFTAAFEPIMLVFMGAVIGTMVVGMFLPIFQIASLGTH